MSFPAHNSNLSAECAPLRNTDASVDLNGIDEVNEFVCSHVGAHFWSHFDWFDFAAVNDEDFADKLEKSLFKANTDLLIAKRGIMDQYEALCEENLIQANFSAPGVQRAIIRTLHHLETLWHLVVLPTPSVSLGVGVKEAAIRGGLWKKLCFSLFSTHFDRVFGAQEEGEEKEEEPSPKGFESGFEDVVRQLNALFLLEPLNDVLKAMICDKIQARISANMVGVFDAKNQLKEAQEWLVKSCLNFLAFVLSPDLERDSLESLLKDWEEARLKEREKANGEVEEESNFDFKSSTKRVASNVARSGGSAYPVRDLSSSIKRSKSSIGGSQRRAEESDDEFDMDFSSLLASSQPQFTPHAVKDAMKVGSRVTSPLGNVSRMSSPLRPSSPLHASKIPSSPIPLSASLNGMAEWLKKNSFGRGAVIQAQTKDNSTLSISYQISSKSTGPSSSNSSLHRSPSNSQTLSRALLLGNNQSSPHHPLRFLSKWRAQLTSLLLELTLKLRISELFSLIVDYPNSLPALEDLRTCLNVTGQYGELVKSLRGAFAKRLMHPGATTSDIVSIYISCIRAIKEIDPSTVLLSLVTVDLREYLRQRSDSLKNLVSLLSEDGGESGISLISDLEESATNSNNASSAHEHDVDSEDENDLDTLITANLPSIASSSSTYSSITSTSSSSSSSSWNPSPIIRAPRFPSSQGSDFTSTASVAGGNRGPKDIISMLIAIHGSKENFIAEYANLLALRLLSLSDFDTESEVKNVELMKLKFGEAQMLQCEVMLKDMAESKRANTNIHLSIKEALAKGLNVLPKKKAEDDEAEEEEMEAPEGIYNEEGVEISNVIFSHLYWPSSFQPLPITLPEPWNSQRLAIEHQFSTLKSSRSLVWYDTMGTVELELSLRKDDAQKDGEGDATDQDAPMGEGTLEDEESSPAATPAVESKTFTVTPIQAAIIMLFEEAEEWDCETMVEALKIPSVEVLRRHASLWISNGILLEPEAGMFRLSDRLDMSDAIEEDGGLEMEEEAESNFDEFIPFIIAMLKNLGALPIAKIHQKMTNFNADYELTIQQLKELLEKMVTTEALDFASGQYSIMGGVKK